jgi:hypothetical protein
MALETVPFTITMVIIFKVEMAWEARWGWKRKVKRGTSRGKSAELAIVLVESCRSVMAIVIGKGTAFPLPYNRNASFLPMPQRAGGTVGGGFDGPSRRFHPTWLFR